MNHEAVNYRLRPAKGTERKMLCEVMRRLSLFGPLDKYSYIGFGSIYFTDFLLFRKALGMTEMHSIEQEIGHELDEFTQNRYEFNKPYSCIKIHFGTSNEHLPNMPWRNGMSIVWLDYVKGLTDKIMHDLQTVAQRAQAGSFISITVNVEAERKPGASFDEEEQIRQQALRKRLSAKYIPSGTDKNALSTPDLVTLYHSIMTSHINRTLTARCGAAPEENKIIAHQVINIQYADGPSMLTLGWILVKKKDQESFNKAKFTDLSFYKSDSEPFRISVPNLTIKEISWLDAVIHGVQVDDDDNITYSTKVVPAPALDPDDVREYKQIYRYFPTFAEAIL